MFGRGGGYRQRGQQIEHRGLIVEFTKQQPAHPLGPGAALRKRQLVLADGGNAAKPVAPDAPRRETPPVGKQDVSTVFNGRHHHLVAQVRCRVQHQAPHGMHRHEKIALPRPHLVPPSRHRQATTALIKNYLCFHDMDFNGLKSHVTGPLIWVG